MAGQPTPIILTDSNGVPYTLALAASGAQAAAPLPCVLTDVNGNVLSLAPAGVVFSETVPNQNAITNIYATAFTTTAAGIYRISGLIYPTTLSSSAWTVEIACSVAQNGSAGAANQTYLLNQCAIGTAISSGSFTSVVVALAKGATIGAGTFLISGSNTGGVFTYSVVVERLA